MRPGYPDHPYQKETMKRARSIAIWLAGCTSILLFACGLVVFVFSHKFYPNAPEANFPTAQDVTTEQRQDFDYFQSYFELNRSFTPDARARAAQLLAEYKSKQGSFSPAQFDLAIARIVALADNGHSRVEPGPLSRRHNRIACRMYRFSDGYYFIRARPACRELLGAKVTAVDGHLIEEVADRMFEYFGGPRNHYDQFASVFFLESPELLQAAGLASALDRLNLHVVLRDGSEKDVVVIAEPPDAAAPRVYSDTYLSPQRIEMEAADWETVLAADARLPIFLRDYSNPFHSEYWADKGVLYAQFRSNDDEAGRSIGDFIKRIEHAIVADRPRSIVLDLRFDQGGNFITTASLMKTLTTLTDSVERVYVLTSAWTFSAGDVSLALVKEHGGNKVTVIGEPVGDRIRLWAEGGTMTLPNSKLSIGFATGLHDYAHPCWKEYGCFWSMYFFPMHVTTLEPNIRVGYSFHDYVNLRDPVLERVLELARNQ